MVQHLAIVPVVSVDLGRFVDGLLADGAGGLGWLQHAEGGGYTRGGPRAEEDELRALVTGRLCAVTRDSVTRDSLTCYRGPLACNSWLGAAGGPGGAHLMLGAS